METEKDLPTPARGIIGLPVYLVPVTVRIVQEERAMRVRLADLNIHDLG